MNFIYESSLHCCTTKAFLRSRLPSVAPTEDLKCIEAMFWYKEEDENVAAAATSSIKHHMWHLTREVAVFVLFKEELDAILRSDMAKTLFKIERQYYFNYDCN